MSQDLSSLIRDSYPQGLNRYDVETWVVDAIQKIEQKARAVDRLTRENEALRRDFKLMERKVITCGVAATNPDPKLTLREDYMQWNSPQAESVRALRGENEALRALLDDSREIINDNLPGYTVIIERIEAALRGKETTK